MNVIAGPKWRFIDGKANEIAMFMIHNRTFDKLSPFSIHKSYLFIIYIPSNSFGKS